MKKLLLILLSILFLCGCERKECVKGHTEMDTCIFYTYVYTGKTMIPIPHYYDCEKWICDEWRIINE